MSENLQFRCPVTGQLYDTGWDVWSYGMADNWDRPLTIHCTACGQDHSMVVRDLYTARLFGKQ